MSPRKKSAPKINSDSEFERAESAANFIFTKTNLRPKIALVLGSGLGAFADEFDSPSQNPLRRNPAFPPLHRHRPRRPTRSRQSRRNPRRRNARPRPSVRRLFRQRRRLSHSRFRAHGHQSRHPHQRRRRHQTRIRARPARGNQRSHQSPGRRALSPAPTTSASARVFLT